jgi:hypothetical protein
MFPNPLTWLAGKLAAPVLAAIGIAAVIVAGVQTVRLDGVHLFGWTIHEGALDREAANLKSAQDWEGKANQFKTGLDTCNDSVTALADQTKAIQADLDGKWKALLPTLSKMNADAAHILALKPKQGQSQCDFAFDVLTGRAK